MEELKEAVKKAQDKMSIEQLAVKYGISSQSLYRALNGKMPSQARVKSAVTKIIKDFQN